MEHVFNCHGEWLVIFQSLLALPILGAWVRARMQHKHGEKP